MNINNDQRYNLRGVSASKEDVHDAIKNIDKGIFPKAFCKIIPDILCGDKDYCNIMHADGAGTKSSLAYAYWKETGDLSVWKGIAQDALIMNIDDLLCVGATDNILLSSTIGRNKLLIPGEVIAAIINGTGSLSASILLSWLSMPCSNSLFTSNKFDSTSRKETNHLPRQTALYKFENAIIFCTLLIRYKGTMAPTA